MSDGEKKSKLSVAWLICAIAAVVLFAIINLGAITNFMSGVISLLTPLLIGFALAYILDPILRLFEFKIYKKIPNKNALRALSIVSTYVFALLIVVAFFWLLIPSVITSIVDLFGKYDEYIAHTTDFVNGIINKVMSNEAAARYIEVDDIKKVIVNFFSTSGDILSTVTEYIFEYGAGLFVGVKNAVLGIFISVYILISKERLQAQIRKFSAAVLPGNRQKRITKYINLTHRTFSGFFVGKIIDSAIIMLLTFVLMLILRLEYPLLISVIVGVTNIIPIFGPIIGAVPSFFILFIVEPRQALIFLVLIIIIQQIDGNVIGPKILGDSIGISSLSVIVAIVIMGDLFGIMGMIIGVPIFAVVITIVKELVETQLKKKGKSIDTADYYAKDSIVDPHEHHEHAAQKVFNNLKRYYQKIESLVKKVVKKINKLRAKNKNEELAEAEEKAEIEEKVETEEQTTDKEE